MAYRSIRKILPAQKVNMGGIMLDQPLPLGNVQQIDPFLLVHHWAETMEPGQNHKQIGVGPHPHRGFSPVTFIFKGDIHHRDSLANSTIVKGGGTQWISSGKGIVHSERPSKAMAKSGGEFEIIQWWVNSPISKKMDPAYYEALQPQDTPTVLLEDKRSSVGVVNGIFRNTKGAITPPNPMLNLRFELKQGAKVEIPITHSYNAFVYQLDGALRINTTKESKAKDLIWFAKDGDSIQLEAIQDTRAILLSGEPLNEPTVSYGPFVMSTQTEIMEAIRDYQQGKMGILIEEFD